MKLPRVILIFISFSFLSCSAMAGTLYVGASSSGNHMNFKKDFGDVLAPGGVSMSNSIFLGSSLYSDLFGLELGTSFQNTGSFKARIYDDDPEFGIPDYTGLGDDDFENRLKINRFYLHLYKNFNVSENISFSPYVGFSYVKARLSARMILNDGFPVTRIVAAANNFTAKDSKFLPRIGLLMNLNLSDDYGFRFGLGFEDTSRLKLKSYDIPARLRNGVNYYPEAKPNNTTIVELGLFVTF